MEKNKETEVESSPKITPPELKEFSELIEREAYRKQLLQKNGSWNQLEKVAISIWQPKFELEDFIVPPKEVQLPRVRSEPLMKEKMQLEQEERERLMRGTKRVRESTSSSSTVAEEKRSQSNGERFDFDLNKLVEESSSDN